MYLINETTVMIERINELDNFNLGRHSIRMRAQADVEFFLDDIMGTKPSFRNRIIFRIGDFLILSGGKLKAWSST